jgi:hypothetical protein
MKKFWLTKACQLIFSGQSHAREGDLLHIEEPKASSLVALFAKQLALLRRRRLFL